MASGPHERDRRRTADEQDTPGAQESQRAAGSPLRPPSGPSSAPPPTLHHRPPAPSSPWSLPPFGAPVPEDAASEEPGSVNAGIGDAGIGDDEDTRPYRTIGDRIPVEEPADRERLANSGRSGGGERPAGRPEDGGPAGDPAGDPGGDRERAGDTSAGRDLWSPRPGPDAGPQSPPQPPARERPPRTGRRPYGAPYGTAEPRHSRSGGRGEGGDPGESGGPGGDGPPAAEHGGTTWHGEGARSTPSTGRGPAAGDDLGPWSGPASSAGSAGERESGTEPGQGRRRRLVDRPDKLVASGPPRPRRARIPRENPDGPGAPELDTPPSGPLRETDPELLARDEPVRPHASPGQPVQETGGRASRGRSAEDEHVWSDASPGEQGRESGGASRGSSVEDEHVWSHTPPEPAPRHGRGRPQDSGETGAGGIRMRPEIPVEPEQDDAPGHQRPVAPPRPPTSAHPAGEQGEQGEQDKPVERIGRPPGGRPARRVPPDVLVAVGPPRGGRRHRRVLPARRLPRMVTPVIVVLVLVAAAVLGVAVVRWTRGPATAGLRLAAGDGQSGDAAFAAPGLPGNGSSQVLNAFTAVGSTVVAAGSDTTGALARPLFLVSADGGAHWRLGRVTGSPGYETTGGAIGRVTGGDGRWLAVGTDAPGSAGPAARGMWVSSDGRSWTAVDPARLTAFWSQDRITDIARTATGFLAVGATTLRDGTAGPVAWVSPDGTGWTRIDTDQIGTPDKVRAMRALAARGDRVVALADPGTGDSVSVILRSDDGGRTWLRTAAALADVRPEPGALAASEKGFLLVPTRQKSDSGEVRVYCSPDGADWGQCGTIGPLGAEGTGVRGLASSAAGVAAVAESAWERYAVYTSKDGRAWAKSADLGEIPGTLRGLAITDAGLLVAGGDKRGPGDVENLPVLMTAGKGKAARAVPLKDIDGLNRLARDTADVAAADGTFVAVGSANGDAAVWTSGNNGANWTDAAFPDLLGGPGRQALSGVAHGPKGWLAAGSTMTDPAVTRPLLVTSSDGKTWRPGPAIEVPAGHFLLAPRVVAAGPKGYVLAGEDRSATGVLPALWFSPDLKRFTRSAPRSMPAGGAGVRLYDVTATPRGFVAVGGSGTADRETGVVWVSSDGLNWTARGRVLPPDSASAGLRHVVATEAGIVAVGVALTEDGLRPFSALSTDDGAHWEYGTPPAEAAASVLDVTATSRGFVAVGSHQSSAAGGEGDSAAWISGDGVDWSRQTLTQDGLGGPGSQWLGAVAVSGSRVVAIGRSTGYADDHLTIWRSTVTDH